MRSSRNRCARHALTAEARLMTAADKNRGHKDRPYFPTKMNESRLMSANIELDFRDISRMHMPTSTSSIQQPGAEQ